MPGKQKGTRHVNGRLSAATVNRGVARKLAPGRYPDGRGLMLEVRPGGAAHWIQRLTIHGTRRDIGLGSLTTTSLGDARRGADANYALARRGGDPVSVKREQAAAALAPDFETATRQCFEARVGTWRNAKHQWQWLQTMEAYVFPKLGRRRVETITGADVLEVLSPIWVSKHETAKRVRQRIGLVLDWAKAKGWRREGSPTHEIGTALPKVRADRKHHPAMPYAEVPAFISALHASTASAGVKGAMEVLILTACRSGEVLQARLGEVDFARSLWTIPAERMKTKRPHVVPLSPRALAIFKDAAEKHSGKGDFVFESRPGRAFSQMPLVAYMRRAELPYVPHGFRSSFRDFASERTNVAREVAEAALAHTVQNRVEAAYARSDLLEKRRKLMAQWAAHCAGGGAVVQLQARRA